MLTAKWKSWSIAACACLIAGCASPMPPSAARSPLDVSLTEPCPPLSPLADGTGATVLRWIIGTAENYADCSARHRALTKALR